MYKDTQAQNVFHVQTCNRYVIDMSETKERHPTYFLRKNLHCFFNDFHICEYECAHAHTHTHTHTCIYTLNMSHIPAPTECIYLCVHTHTHTHTCTCTYKCENLTHTCSHHCPAPIRPPRRNFSKVS